MTYAALLRLEGRCSIALGLALALVAAPGLVVDYPGAWAGPLTAVAALAAMAAWGTWRHGADPRRPGTWLTTRSLRGTRPGRPALAAPRLRRRLLLETALWIVAVGAWVVLARQSGLLVFATGLASAAFGAVQAFAAAPHVAALDAERGAPHLVAARPGLGTPELTVAG